MRDIPAWGSCFGVLEKAGSSSPSICSRKTFRTFRYLRKDWHLLLIDPTYDCLDFDLANLPVGLVPHDLSSLEKQRKDFIAMWSAPAAGSIDEPTHPTEN